MPKFIYTIALTTILLWGVFVKYISNIQPQGFFNIAGGLILLLITLTFTISLLFFYFSTKKHRGLKKYDDEDFKLLYRKDFKLSLITSALIIAILGIRVISVLK